MTGMRRWFALGAVLMAGAGARGQFLMMPDSTSDDVLLFSAFDGSLVNPTFIDGTGTLSTPINAISVGNEVWISDQIGDNVFRYDQGGSFLGKVLSGGLDNVRGIDVKGSRLYISNAGTANGAPGVAVVVTDLAGSLIATWKNVGDPFDVLARSRDFLVNDIGTSDKIQRFDGDGNLLGPFAGPGLFSFPEQMTERSNGNVLLATFSSPGAGIYEFDSAGNKLNFWGVGTGLRGVHELGNGKILWSSGSGVFVLDPGTGLSTPVVAGSGFRFIEPLVPEPATLSLLLLAGGFALGTRRRK